MKTHLTMISLIGMLTAEAQEKSVNTQTLFPQKHTFQLGFQSNFGLGKGLNREPGTVLNFNPKLHYFITERLSFGIGYMATQSKILSYTDKNPGIHHNVEFELNYYLIRKKGFFMYSQIGYFIGQFTPPSQYYSSTTNNPLHSMFKFGLGVGYRFKNAPNLCFNAELNKYPHLQVPNNSAFQYIPNFSAGFSYNIPRLTKRKQGQR